MVYCTQDTTGVSHNNKEGIDMKRLEMVEINPETMWDDHIEEMDRNEELGKEYDRINTNICKLKFEEMVTQMRKDGVIR